MFLHFPCQTIMLSIQNPSSAFISTLQYRRQKLAELIDFPAILWSGSRYSRNFPANCFPFRSSSHFLYFAGLPLEGAVIRLEGGRLELFMDQAPLGSALWCGEMPHPATIGDTIGADAIYPLEKLPHRVKDAATIALVDGYARTQQEKILQRSLPATTNAPQGQDYQLARAIITLRLCHDLSALAELKRAGTVTIAAHQAGMAVTREGCRESDVRAAMERVILAENMTCAYNSIVTVHGEVLHNERYHHTLQSGDLLLADVGAETELGWAADITRTWPVSGKFSATQREIYNLVLAAHDTCIDKMRPGVEYRDIHLTAASVIATGLVEIGILKGKPDQLVEMDAHALFFPHGIGHLLGLDVHDMEDLGDLAGYAEGRSRSDRFGLGFLRLNRPLQAGMLVTIEPGFYQVPAILQDPKLPLKYQKVINWERLEQFADVRGIRIEDDVLITGAGAEVLTASLPTQADTIEEGCRV